MRDRPRPTIIDVARVAGVSPTTVSYVLSGPKERAARISDDTATRIREAVAELGYVPNQSARTLRLKRTNRVLFLGSRFDSLYSQAMARSIEDRLTRYGLTLGVQIGAAADHVDRAITALERHEVDGLIVETGDEFMPLLREVATRGHAIVAIGPSEADDALDVISNDDAPAIQDAMHHAIERGYRHFMLYSSLPVSQKADSIHRGHRVQVAYQHLLSLGVDNESITVVHCPHDRMAAYDCTLSVLEGMTRRVAIYAGADVSAFGVLWACLQRKRRIPDDVAIIGHGNTPETRITIPPLTSLGPIEVDFSRAADLLASRLKDRSLPGRHIVDPCQLSIRGTT